MKNIVKITKDKSVVSLWVDDKRAYKLDFADGTVIGLSKRKLINPPNLFTSDKEGSVYSKIIRSFLSYDFIRKSSEEKLFLSSCWEQLIAADLLQDAYSFNIYNIDYNEVDKKIISKYIKYKNKGGELSLLEYLKEYRYIKWLKENHFNDSPHAKELYTTFKGKTFKHIKLKVILDILQHFEPFKEIMKAYAFSYWYTGLIEQLENDLAVLNVMLDEKKTNYMAYCAEMHELAEAEKNKENNIKIQATMAVHSNWWKYQDENFIVVVPQTVADIKEEGEKQNNCVGRLYTQQVINGLTQVVFIRKRECPEKSYITCEVNNDGFIRQFLLACNRRVEKDSIEQKFYYDFQNYIDNCKKKESE